ncbi:MAG: hypothetical protein EOP11_05995 [Proteobacteria bacterium]|nr:MAG: hypothetical protein EOP11_05995 [Pseudomonadota bacterium]
MTQPNSATSKLYPALGAALLFAGGLAAFTTLYMGVATFAYALMILGMVWRRRARETHRQLMFSGMGIDLSLVLLLELQRSATATAFGFKLGPWQMAHVGASTLAVALYLPMIYVGMKLMEKETAGTRKLHRRLGYTTFFFRSLGFVLMFSLLWKAA